MRRNSKGLIALILVLVLVLSGLVYVAANLDQFGGDTLQTDPSNPPSSSEKPTQTQTDPTQTNPTQTQPTTQPTDPPIIKLSTATLGAVGDVLLHDDVIKSGDNDRDKNYDFHSIFQKITPYFSKTDYMVANLEVTLCGDNNGYEYDGYPHFNSPDAIAEALQDAGVDMLLTANNHSYDTRHVGFMRTQEVLAKLGLDHTGTRPSVEDDTYIIREINGIRIGMICYTYHTGITASGGISLNVIPLTPEDSKLVNAFSYDNLGLFYDELSGKMEEMTLAGAEATVMFIHWGDEYRLNPNASQKAIAQKLCDMGIVGGHPHVIQPMELLTSTTDPEQKTVCLYSTGNIISNQRLGLISSINTAHTEDGIFFSVTFAKYSDGTVILERVDALPTWVNKVKDGTKLYYDIIPLDTAVTDWKAAYSLTDSELSQCQASYGRTMALIGSGLEAVNSWCSRHQTEVEILLGVQ